MRKYYSHGGEEYPTYSTKTGHILRTNRHLTHIIEGKVGGRIEVVRRKGRRHKQLLNGLKETRGYWKLKDETLDHTPWITRFGRVYGPVVRQTTE
jgi:hypothetical protein